MKFTTLKEILKHNTCYSVLLIMLIVLTSCTRQQPQCPSTIYTTEGYSDAFLTLQPSQGLLTEPQQVSQIYADTMACIGLTAENVTIAYKSFSDNFIGATWAVYMEIGQTIWINTDTNATWLPRTCKTDEQALRHEFIHHILTYNDIPNDRHQSELFSCGLGVNTGEQ